MGYVDLIPDVFRLTMPDLATGKSYHTQKFNIGNKQCIGVTVKASQTLSVSLAYGIASDTPASAGVDIAASLPYKTSATSFASNTSTEGGTYHEIAVPPHARQAQLVISNASGSTVSGAVIDASLRVVSYPSSGVGSSSFGDITGWPGASTDLIRGDGSNAPLSAADIPNHSAALLTSGTLPAARLPGVLADVDTQAELLSAAAAAAASHVHSGSDITSGTVAAARLPALSALSGAVTDGQLPSTSNNSTISAISTVANAALPKAGGTMSQALQFSSGTALSGAGWGIYRSGTNLVFYSGDSNSYGQIGSPYQAQLNLWGAATTYTGSIHEQARLITRANSTAYSICPVASTEVARILLQDNSSKRAVALVDASGTVTFESGSHADYVASSSPASGEVGCYVTGGVFTIKPGSSGTRKISAICQIGVN